VVTIMNQCPFLIIGNGPIKSISHFSKGLHGGMGCKGPLTVDLLHIGLTYIATPTIIMGILEEGGPIVTCLQNLFCNDSSCKVAFTEPIMKLIQKT